MSSEDVIMSFPKDRTSTLSSDRERKQTKCDPEKRTRPFVYHRNKKPESKDGKFGRSKEIDVPNDMSKRSKAEQDFPAPTVQQKQNIETSQSTNPSSKTLTKRTGSTRNVNSDAASSTKESNNDLPGTSSETEPRSAGGKQWSRSRYRPRGPRWKRPQVENGTACKSASEKKKEMGGKENGTCQSNIPCTTQSAEVNTGDLKTTESEKEVQDMSVAEKRLVSSKARLSSGRNGWQRRTISADKNDKKSTKGERRDNKRDCTSEPTKITTSSSNNTDGTAEGGSSHDSSEGSRISKSSQSRGKTDSKKRTPATSASYNRSQRSLKSNTTESRDGRNQATESKENEDILTPRNAENRPPSQNSERTRKSNTNTENSRRSETCYNEPKQNRNSPSSGKVTSLYVFVLDRNSRKQTIVEYTRNCLREQTFENVEWITECPDTSQRMQIMKLTFSSKTKAVRAMSTLKRTYEMNLRCHWDLQGLSEAVLIGSNNRKFARIKSEVNENTARCLKIHRNLLADTRRKYDTKSKQEKPPGNLLVQELGALQSKIQELEMQEKEFLTKCKAMELNISKRVSSADFEKHVKSYRSAVGSECIRLERSLPIYAVRTQILQTVKNEQVVILLGETGSGKSTQLTQYVYESGIAEGGLIVCTQPRKVAATSLATRVASELASNVGHFVGYKTGMYEKANRDTRIMYMTDHALLQECLKDQNLAKYSCIIIDEAHERSLFTDLLLGMVKSCMSRRPELRVIVTSATIDPAVFQRFFNGCPVIRVSGRLFPVDVVYSNVENKGEMLDKYLDMAVEKAREIHESDVPGDILVFLTTPLETERACKRLEKILSETQSVACMQLHGKSQREEQERVFKPLLPGVRKIVFATNCAETSVTIPGIRHVVDTGMVKELQYDPKKNMNCLVVTTTNKSSATQRAGRAGRTMPGICHRLYSESMFHNMEPSLQPELLRVHLGYAILKLMELGVDPLAFSFVESPTLESLQSAKSSLIELGAISDNALTELGRFMAKCPLEPRLGLLLRNSIDVGMPMEGVVIAALSSADGGIFFRVGSAEEKNLADLKKTRFSKPEGDLISMLQAYHEWSIQPEKVKGQWCFDNQVNGKAIKGVRETANELSKILRKEFGIQVNHNFELSEQTFPSLQEIIFKSFRRNVCFYLGEECGGFYCVDLRQRVHLRPGSSNLSLNHPPDWIVFDQITKTTKDYVGNATAVPENLLPLTFPSGQKGRAMSLGEVKSLRLEKVCEVPLGKTALAKFVGPCFANISNFEQKLCSEINRCCKNISCLGNRPRDDEPVTQNESSTSSSGPLQDQDNCAVPDVTHTETPPSPPRFEVQTESNIATDHTQLDEDIRERRSSMSAVHTSERPADEEATPKEVVLVVDADKRNRLIRVFASQLPEGISLVTSILEPVADCLTELEKESKTESVQKCGNYVKVVIGRGGLTKRVLHGNDFSEVTVFGGKKKTDDETEEILSKIGKIEHINWIRTDLKDKHMKCKVHFENPDDASDSVFASENDLLGDLVVKPAITQGRQTRAPEPRTVHVELRVLRRLPRKVFLRFNDEELYNEVRELEIITITGTESPLILRECDREDRLELFANLTSFNRQLSPNEIRQAIIDQLGEDYTGGNFGVHVALTRVSDTEETLGEMESALVRRFTARLKRFLDVKDYRFHLDVQPPERADVFYVANVSLKLSDTNVPTKALFSVFEKLDDGRHVEVVVRSDTITMRVNRNVYEVCEKTISSILSKDSKSGVQNTKRWAELTLTTVQQRDEIMEVIQEEVIECSKDLDLLQLSSECGNSKVRDVERSTTTDIYLNIRDRRVIIHGAPENRREARNRLEDYLRVLDLDDSRDINLRDADKPRGLMKALLAEVGPDLHGIFSIEGISFAHLLFSRQILSIRGSTEAIEEVLNLLQAVETKLTNTETAGIAKSELECSSCFVEVDSIDFYRLEHCGHAYCKACFRQQYQFAIQNTEFPISCGKCNKPWVWLDISNAILAGNSSLQDLLSASLSHYVNENLQDVRPCPTTDCEMVYKVSEERNEFRCPLCETRVCTACHMEYHFSLKCIKGADRDARGTLEAWRQEDSENRKQCPKCGITIEKNSGCDHVRCRMCKAHLCWICLEIFRHDTMCYKHLRAVHGGIGLLDDGIGVPDYLLELPLREQRMRQAQVNQFLHRLPRAQAQRNGNENQRVGQDAVNRTVHRENQRRNEANRLERICKRLGSSINGRREQSQDRDERHRQYTTTPDHVRRNRPDLSVGRGSPVRRSDRDNWRQGMRSADGENRRQEKRTFDRGNRRQGMRRAGDRYGSLETFFAERDARNRRHLAEENRHNSESDDLEGKDGDTEEKRELGVGARPKYRPRYRQP